MLNIAPPHLVPAVAERDGAGITRQLLLPSVVPLLSFDNGCPDGFICNIVKVYTGLDPASCFGAKLRQFIQLGATNIGGSLYFHRCFCVFKI